MAMYDWNHNGKNDRMDNYIEYQVYKKVSGEMDKPSYTSSRSSGMSTFGAIVSVIGGLILQALLYTVLDIEVDNVPILVILILWVIFSGIVAVAVDKIGL